MTSAERRPLFDQRLRERLLGQRVLVLDGVLDDDNGDGAGGSDALAGQ
jgi:ATP-dependent Clp protease protease subunit